MSSPTTRLKIPTVAPLPPSSPIQPVGVFPCGVVVVIDGELQAVRFTQLTRRRLAAWFAGSPELLDRWPHLNGRPGWSAFLLSEAIVIACAHLGPTDRTYEAGAVEVRPGVWRVRAPRCRRA
jgi:hypothetical protein